MRHPWYPSGDLFLPPQIRKFLQTYIIGNDTSLFYISYWSLLHGMTGVIFSLFSNSLQAYIVTHTIWELWQIHIGMTPLHTWRGVFDVFADTFMGILGFLLGKNGYLT